MSNLYVTQTVNGDLQPVKVNGESSALEIAQDEIKVKTLEIDGISKVPTPTANHHIANKKYVDDNAGGGGFSSFTLTGDSGSDQTIEDGNTVDIEGGTGIDTTVGATDKVSIALASGSALTNLGGGSGTTFLKKDGTWATPTDTNTTYTAGDFITLTGTDFDVDVKDEDNMASDSATHLCTQQSIKAYVDAHTHFGGIAYSGTLIKVYPTAWRVNDDYGRLPNLIEDDTTDTLGMRVGSTNEEGYAFVPIPTGYKATHVQVHASASTSNGAMCKTFNYTTGATTDLETFDLNTNENITDVTASTTNDLVIKYMGLSNSVIVYGATVTIATV